MVGEMRLFVVTLSTDDNLLVRNFEKTASYFGYDYYIVGRGHQFQGWPWRTQLYIKSIKQLTNNDDDVFILCDSNDFIFIGPASEMLEKFVQSGERVLIGGEPACCNGRYGDRKHRHIALKKVKERIPSRYRFPNGGFIIGYKRDLIKLLKSNAGEWDDQGGYLQKFMDHDPRFSIDWRQSLAGNMPNMHDWYRVNDDDKKRPEYDYWEWDESRKRYRNKLTGEYPCAMHFPGKYWPGYNMVVKHMFPSKNVQQDVLDISLPYQKPRLIANAKKINLLASVNTNINYGIRLAILIASIIFLIFLLIILPVLAISFKNSKINKVRS